MPDLSMENIAGNLSSKYAAYHFMIIFGKYLSGSNNYYQSNNLSKNYKEVVSKYFEVTLDLENISEENYYKLRNESIRATSDMNIIDLGSENLDKSTQERKYYNIFYITKSVVVLAKDYSYDNKIKCLEKSIRNFK